jgi:hypothetical protein
LPRGEGGEGEQQGRGLAGVFLTGSTPLAALPQIVGRAYVACNVVASSSPLHSPTVEWMVDVRRPSCSLCSCLIRSTSDYWRADPRTFWQTYSRNHDPRSMISRHDFLQNTRADRTYSLLQKKKKRQEHVMTKLSCKLLRFFDHVWEATIVRS